MPMYQTVLDDWASRMSSALGEYEGADPEDKETKAREAELVAIEFKKKHFSRSFAAAAENPAPPSVFSVSPSDGQIHINSGVTPAVTFTRSMFPASVVAGAFEFSSNGGAFTAFNSVSLDDSGKVATLTKAGGFSAGATIQVRVLTSVCDTEGVSMVSTYTQNLGFVINP